MDAHNIFLDRDDDIDFHLGGNLPHWHQDGKVQYVTFRLADSLPREKQEELRNFIANFKTRNPGEWNESQKKEYRKTITEKIEKLLDNGYGSCIFKNPGARKILSDALLHYDGIKYDVIAYVIMPNHVHLLILLYPGEKLNSILHSIKGYSSQMINKIYNRNGKLWLRESYDYIVRNPDNLKHCRNYIINNPGKLKQDTYELYVK